MQFALVKREEEAAAGEFDRLVGEGLGDTEAYEYLRAEEVKSAELLDVPVSESEMQEDLAFVERGMAAARERAARKKGAGAMLGTDVDKLFVDKMKNSKDLGEFKRALERALRAGGAAAETPAEKRIIDLLNERYKIGGGPQGAQDGRVNIVDMLPATLRRQVEAEPSFYRVLYQQLLPDSELAGIEVVENHNYKNAAAAALGEAAGEAALAAAAKSLAPGVLKDKLEGRVTEDGKPAGIKERDVDEYIEREERERKETAERYRAELARLEAGLEGEEKAVYQEAKETGESVERLQKKIAALEAKLAALEARIAAQGARSAAQEVGHKAALAVARSYAELDTQSKMRGKFEPELAALEARIAGYKAEIAAAQTRLKELQDWITAQARHTAKEQAANVRWARAEAALAAAMRYGKVAALLAAKQEGIAAARKIKAEMQKTMDGIMRPPGTTIAVKARREIEAVQALLRPDSSKRVGWQGKFYDIADFKKQVAAGKIEFEELSPRLQKRVGQSSIAEFTYEELRDLARGVENMRNIGRAERKMELEIQRVHQNAVRNLIYDRVRARRVRGYEWLISGKDKEKLAGVRGVLKRLQAARDMATESDLYLEGIDPVLKEVLFDGAAAAFNAEKNQIFTRTLEITEGQDFDAFLGDRAVKNITFEHGRDNTAEKLSKADLMTWYIGRGNEYMKNAILYGRFLSAAQQGELYTQLFGADGEGKTPAVMDAARQWAYETYGAAREGELNALAESVLSAEDKAVAERIRDNFAAHHEQTREVAAFLYNTDVGTQVNYLPMIVQGLDGTKNDKQQQKELLTVGNTAFNASPERGHTIERVRLDPWNAKSIETDIFKIMTRGIEREEHFKAFGGLSKDWNLPVVCDVFLCAIKETVGFQRTKKCAGEKPHKGRRPIVVFCRPSPLLRASPAKLGRAYSPVIRSAPFTHIIFYPIIFYTILYTSKFIFQLFQSFFAPITEPPRRHGRRRGVGIISLHSCFFAKNCGVWGATGHPADAMSPLPAENPRTPAFSGLTV